MSSALIVDATLFVSVYVKLISDTARLLSYVCVCVCEGE